MKIFQMYSFQIVLIGTVLLAISASLIGSINVYKNQSLIGDALGHSTLPGIILAYMLSLEKDPLILLIGAICSSGLSYILIHYSSSKSKIGPDANMAIFLSGFFGFGLVLKSYIQGNPNFVGASKAGLDNYIFGQAAYLQKKDIYLILFATIIVVLLIGIYYRDLKCYLFDKEYASLIGVDIKKLDILILFLTILVIGVGIKVVGVILISSLMIIPIVSASKVTNNFLMLLTLSALFSVIGSIMGSLISTIYQGFSTGPTIILCQGLISLMVIAYTKIKKGDKCHE